MTCPTCKDRGYTDEFYGVEYSIFCREKCAASERKRQVDAFAYILSCMVLGHARPW
jgi:hypothetical protein